MTAETQEVEKQKIWFEGKIGDQAFSLDAHGSTEGGAKRFASKGDQPFAIYVNPETADLSLYKLVKEGESFKREKVAPLFVTEGIKAGEDGKKDKEYFFLANRKEGIAINLHGHKELVESMKSDLRSIRENIKLAVEEYRANQADADPAPEEKKSRRPKP